MRQLLSHRAGVFDVFNDTVPASSNAIYAGQNYVSYVRTNEPDHQFTLDELIEVNAVNQLSYGAPDALYKYTDTGYMLLAAIIERVSGKSYERFISENFLAPMGLTNTSAPWNANDQTLPSPFLRGYSRWDAEFFETTEDNMSSQVGPGNIISTPADMAHWIRTLLSGRGPLMKDQITRMTTVPGGNTTYALGIGSYKDVGIGHTGAHPGYVNLVAYNPQDDVAVVVVTPFIDYNSGNMDKLLAHLTLLSDIGKEASKIAGYTGTWPKQPEGRFSRQARAAPS